MNTISNIHTHPALRDLRSLLSLPQEQVEETAVEIASSFSEDPQFHEGVRRLLRSSEGLSPSELIRDADMFTHQTDRACHNAHEPLFALREVFAFHIDQLRLACLLRRLWKFGKFGFGLLPEPAATDLDVYRYEADDLVEKLTGEDRLDAPLNPAFFLTNDIDGPDLDFWHWLPDRFRVYRGAAGLSPEQCAAGVCWTARREVAEWFATRHLWDVGEPVVVGAWVHKPMVATVFADEWEVVVQPGSFQRLKVRPPRGGSAAEDRVWPNAP